MRASGEHQEYPLGEPWDNSMKGWERYNITQEISRREGDRVNDGEKGGARNDQESHGKDPGDPERATRWRRERSGEAQESSRTALGREGGEHDGRQDGKDETTKNHTSSHYGSGNRGDMPIPNMYFAYTQNLPSLSTCRAHIST